MYICIFVYLYICIYVLGSIKSKKNISPSKLVLEANSDTNTSRHTNIDTDHDISSNTGPISDTNNATSINISV